MLINLSNHPSALWDSKQHKTAIKRYGNIVDLSFPSIDPHWSKEDILQLADDYFRRITGIFDTCANQPFPHAVHIQGEFTFVCTLVQMLKKAGITCVASTTVRNVIETEIGEKIVKFRFVRFREY